MKIVGSAALKMVEEVLRQFNTIHILMEVHAGALEHARTLSPRDLSHTRQLLVTPLGTLSRTLQACHSTSLSSSWQSSHSYLLPSLLLMMSSDYVADERRYSWLLERNNAQTSLLPTSDCAAGGYIHGGLKENNAKIVPLQNFEDVLGFLLTPVTNLTKRQEVLVISQAMLFEFYEDIEYQ
ncbi:Uncharacterized protein Fot_41965 [Forsythia ovata]|uniref:Uncharacterized protein n=1 Tax=Forsythia ovata TaxID=205694 RepID=A0ABD1RJU4_9LAMI